MYNTDMANRILIVDDTRSWLLFHSELIRQLYGDLFEITLANCAEDALDIIRHSEVKFDLIITDLQMESKFEPQLAGEWLVEHIKSMSGYSDTKIIIVSAMYNIEYIASNLNVECISKTLLIHNKLLMKFMFEKLMPFLSNIE